MEGPARAQRAHGGAGAGFGDLKKGDAGTEIGAGGEERVAYQGQPWA